MNMTPADPSMDPRPLPPEPPGDDECCRSGCDPCIFDYYQQELQQYREELAAWEARQAARGDKPAE
jgi:hypothetical protein